MQELYSQQYYSDIQAQLHKRLALLAAVGAVCLGVFVWAMIARLEFPAIASLVLFCVFAIF